MSNVVLNLLLVLSATSMSCQDGFNFYKALNRTPISRVERFYHDEITGSNRPFKVPLTLSKRLGLLYEDIADNKVETVKQNQNEEFLSLLRSGFKSKVKLRDELDIGEADLKTYIDLLNLLSDVHQ